MVSSTFDSKFNQLIKSADNVTLSRLERILELDWRTCTYVLNELRRKGQIEREQITSFYLLMERCFLEYCLFYPLLPLQLAEETTTTQDDQQVNLRLVLALCALTPWTQTELNGTLQAYCETHRIKLWKVLQGAGLVINNPNYLGLLN